MSARPFPSFIICLPMIAAMPVPKRYIIYFNRLDSSANNTTRIYMNRLSIQSVLLLCVPRLLCSKLLMKVIFSLSQTISFIRTKQLLPLAVKDSIADYRGNLFHRCILLKHKNAFLVSLRILQTIWQNCFLYFTVFYKLEAQPVDLFLCISATLFRPRPQHPGDSSELPSTC